MMQSEIVMAHQVRRALLTSNVAKATELVGVFAPGLVAMILARSLVGENPLALHGLIFVANLMMLAVVWIGMRLRGEDCSHFGLSFHFAGRRTFLITVLQSIVVFVLAIAAVVVGAIVMRNIVGVQEGADMSGYNYLRGNLPMLIVALLAVYITASFGEEVIYRAFLINRIAEMGSGGKSAWVLAVVISSIVFGVIHSQWALTGMVQMGFMGLALGMSYLIVGRNLWVTIMAHAYLDTILLLQMYGQT